jgi:hypothetical protein
MQMPSLHGLQHISLSKKINQNSRDLLHHVSIRKSYHSDIKIPMLTKKKYLTDDFL